MSELMVLYICVAVVVCVIFITLGVLVYCWIDNYSERMNYKQVFVELKRMQEQINTLYAEINSLKNN